ncbi:hypothetical protein KY495_07015 [Massilia sp. PAMC28688]|uniref:hypothetical protein n=1 Tax=Massilia sp. PAMC28688 TaxID=2861283 RepID=UPI001C628A4B|nr:hypothetical protein [Massilia sp. PAMC28688]QYF94921.1 hypothetical protein KY495_07015 [Massilia sp. PAMC28688]
MRNSRQVLFFLPLSGHSDDLPFAETSNPNPYSAPQSDLSSKTDAFAGVPLWNPNAAACWSLLFTPVFGAILHMKNWEALGRPEKARESKNWAIMAGVVLLVVTAFSAMAAPGSLGDRMGNIVGIALLAAWYMSSGRQQVQLVKESGDYIKRGWGKPLLFAVLATVALILFVGVVAFSMESGSTY